MVNCHSFDGSLMSSLCGFSISRLIDKSCFLLMNFPGLGCQNDYHAVLIAVIFFPYYVSKRAFNEKCCIHCSNSTNALDHEVPRGPNYNS